MANPVQASAVGIVSAARGEVFARNPNGEMRRLAVGDTVFEGEAIVTANGSAAEITPFDGPVLNVAEQQTVTLDDQVSSLLPAEDPGAHSIDPLGPTEAARIIQTANPGGQPDFNALLESDAAAAGLNGGDDGGGHSFVNLMRIVETAGGADYVFPPNPPGQPPIIQGSPLGFASLEITVPPVSGTPPDEPPDGPPDTPPTPSHPPLVAATGGQVFEAGLPAGSGDGPQTTVVGHFTVGDPDGLGTIQSITIGSGGDARTFTIDGSGLPGLVGSVITVPYGTIQITGYLGEGQFEFKYVLNSPVANGSPGSATDGAYEVTIPISVSDGKTAASAGIVISIVDDAPAIDVGASGGALSNLTTQDADTLAVGGDSSSQSFAGLFSFSATPGADGTGTAPVLTYALSVTVESGASGLTSGGHAITLVQVGGDIVGRITVGNTTADIFRVSVDGNTGQVTLSQYGPIDHGTGATDALIGLGGGAIQLTASATIVDGDGDTSSASQSIDISTAIQFADDIPILTFGNSIGSTGAGTGYTGNWSADLGADTLQNISDYVQNIALTGVTVGGAPATLSSFVFDPASSSGSGSFSYSLDGQGGTVNFTLSLDPDGTYVVTLDAAPTVVTITPSEYTGAIKASGPTETYIVSYKDGATGVVATAHVSAAPQGEQLTLVGATGAAGSVTENFSATTSGTSINPSGDGIGIDNNVISSYVTVDNKTKETVLTTESLTFDPDSPASAISLAFKATGSVGFGQGGAEDVLYIKLTGDQGQTQTIMLDSRYGDFLVNADGTLTAIASSAYAGGGLDSYTVTKPADWGSIDKMEVTAGFYTDSHGNLQTTDIKVSFGFSTAVTTEVDQPVTLNFTATVTDADGDTDSANFSVQTLAGHTFTGTGQADSIFGTADSDVIRGGGGSDVLWGGGGTDTFVWQLSQDSASSSPSVDVVKDFGQGDKLMLQDLVTQDASTISVVQQNGSTSIHVANGSYDQTIVLEGYTGASADAIKTALLNSKSFVAG